MRFTAITLLILTVHFSNATSKSGIESLHKQAYALLDTNLGAAMVLTDSSLQLAKEADLAWEEANSYYLKGYIYEQQQALPKALFMYLNATSILDLLKEEKSIKTHLDILINVGIILRKYSKYDESIKLYDKGLALYHFYEINSPYKHLKLLYNKAFCLRRQGKTQEALEALKETVSLANKYENDGMLLKSFNLLGLIHEDGKHFTEAREYFHYILDNEKASMKDKAMAYQNISLTYQEEGNKEEAKRYLDQALIAKREINNPSLLFTTLSDLAEWHLNQNDLVSAQVYANEAENLYPLLFSEPEVFDIFFIKGNIYGARGDFETAKGYSDQAYKESNLFIEEQKEVIEQLRQFQMDLVLAGFEAEQQINEEQRKVWIYLWLAIAGGVLTISVWVGWKLWFRRWRHKLWIKTYALMQDMSESKVNEKYPYIPFGWWKEKLS